MQLCADYTRNLRVIASEQTPRVSYAVFSGSGIRLNMYSSGVSSWSSMGLRVPLGVAALPKHLRIDGYLQASPTLQLYPYSALLVEINMGGRYYF